MIDEYWTDDEQRRATEVRDVACWGIESEDATIRSGEAPSWSGVYESKMGWAIICARFNWLLDRSSEISRAYYHIAGESGVTLMGLEDRAPVVVVWADGKTWCLSEKNGEWRHKNKSIQERLEDLLPDWNVLVEDHIPDFSKPFKFVNIYNRQTQTSIPAMETSLASGDMELAERAAELAGSLGDFDSNKAQAWYARVLKYSILGDETRARRSMDELDATPKRSPYHELGRAYRGVLDNDEAAVEKQFNGYLKWFGRKRKPESVKAYDSSIHEWIHRQLIPPDFLISLSGIAFCNFAASRGIKLEVGEVFLPRELLAY